MKGSTHKIEVILDHIILERLSREGAIAHLTDEFMVGEFLPGLLDVWAGEDVFDEFASAYHQYIGAYKSPVIPTERMA